MMSNRWYDTIPSISNGLQIAEQLPEVALEKLVATLEFFAQQHQEGSGLKSLGKNAVVRLMKAKQDMRSSDINPALKRWLTFMMILPEADQLLHGERFQALAKGMLQYISLTQTMGVALQSNELQQLCSVFLNSRGNATALEKYLALLYQAHMNENPLPMYPASS